MRARTAVILLAAVLSAACGDDGDDDVGSGDGSTTTASTDDGSTVDTAADQQAAEDAILVLSDMPSDWVDTDDDADDAPDDADVASEAVLADCFGLDPSIVEGDETDGEPTADSEFESPEGDLSVSSDVQVNPSASEGEDAMAALKGDDAAACFRDGFEAFVEASDVEGVGAVSVERLEFEPVGDQIVAFRITIPIETDEGTVVLLTDAVYATKGRASVSMEFSTPSEPWDIAEAVRLTELVLNRIPSDL